MNTSRTKNTTQRRNTTLEKHDSLKTLFKLLQGRFPEMEKLNHLKGRRNANEAWSKDEVQEMMGVLNKIPDKCLFEKLDLGFQARGENFVINGLDKINKKFKLTLDKKS